MLYVQIFLSFFKIGFFGFGGGLAVISLIQQEIARYGWMSEQEFLDIVAVSQVTPGPIGINCATYVGYTITGNVWGSLLATCSIVLPSLIIMLSICKLYFYLKDRFRNNPYLDNTLYTLRLIVLGLIAAAALCLINEDSFPDRSSWLFFAVVFLLTILPQFYKSKLTQRLSNPILLILLAGFVGYLLYL